jgi:hypothetical protein
MNRSFTMAAGSLLLAGIAAAQGTTLPLTIDNAASQFTYTGTTSVGPIVGNPNTFGLVGTVDALLGGSPGSAIASIQFIPTGNALVSPDINAIIPNPLPFLPALAEISITNLRLALSSPALAVDPSGGFTGTMEAIVLSGLVTIVPLAGATTSTDLTGSDTDPQLVSGTATAAGTSISLSAPLDLPFDLSDPVSGLSGTVNLLGLVEANYNTPTPASYCTAEPNSTGISAAIGTSGTTSISSGNLALTGSALPQNSLGYFLFAQDQGFVPLFGGSSGNLCLSGSLFRLSNFVQSSGGAGQVSLPMPYGNLPGANSFDIGDSWNFQYWYRDQSGGVPTSNTTDGVNITFAP